MKNLHILMSDDNDDFLSQLANELGLSRNDSPKEEEHSIKKATESGKPKKKFCVGHSVRVNNVPNYFPPECNSLLGVDSIVIGVKWDYDDKIWRYKLDRDTYPNFIWDEDLLEAGEVIADSTIEDPDPSSGLPKIKYPTNMRVLGTATYKGGAREENDMLENAMDISELAAENDENDLEEMERLFGINPNKKDDGSGNDDDNNDDDSETPTIKISFT